MNILKKNKHYILDCTLRDGSYAINFKFNRNHTYSISRFLDNNGIKFIEVGHGVGLGASENGYGKAAEKDKTYLKYARKAVRNNFVGTFLIPGIATLDDLNMAINEGIDFIRIGVDIIDYKKSAEYIKVSKKNKIFTCVNFMKSYASPIDKYIEATKFIENLGADIVYIVDSAGAMMEDDLLKFIEAIKKYTKIDYGFHGHNNLGLVHSNSLVALTNGARIIDTSLNGLGRSSGNAVTQIMLMFMAKLKIDNSYNIIDFINESEKIFEQTKIKYTNKIYSPLDSIAGFAKFHSSYIPKILKNSHVFQIDPKVLILEYAKKNKIKIRQDELDKISKKIKNSKLYNKYKFTKKKLNRYYGEEE